MKRCLMLLIIREMQIKTIIRYHLTPVRMNIIKTSTNNKCWKNFPGGPLVKNLPCNAGDVGLLPAWGTKIPHAAEQLSHVCHKYWSLRALESTHCNYWAQKSQLELSQRAAMKDPMWHNKDPLRQISKYFLEMLEAMWRRGIPLSCR